VRVLYWVQRFWPHIGGVEVHSVRFLRAMRERGFELTVLTSPGDLDLPAADSFEGIPLYRMRFEAALSSGDPTRIASVRRRRSSRQSRGTTSARLHPPPRADSSCVRRRWKRWRNWPCSARSARADCA
jgi:hypothetical protein